MRFQYIAGAMILAVCTLASGQSLVMAGPMTRKPQLPITIAIAPAQSGITAATMQPGDVVPFTVTANTVADASEMHLEAELLGGAELVSGTLEWAGAAGKGEDRQISFSVRVPLTGQGRIRATVTITREDKHTMKRTAQYVLGGDERGNKKTAPRFKKDSKGRNIVEY